MYHARKQLSRKRSQRAAAATFSSPSNVRLTNVEYKRRARGFENTERIVSIRIRIRLIWREIFCGKREFSDSFSRKIEKIKEEDFFLLSYLILFISRVQMLLQLVSFSSSIGSYIISFSRI